MPNFHGYEFTIDENTFAQGPGLRAAGGLSEETVVLLQAHAMPPGLELVYESQETNDFVRPHAALVVVPPGRPPSFTAMRTESGGYNVRAVLPFDSKTKRIGANIASYCLAPPPLGYVGWPVRVDQAAREYWLGYNDLEEPPEPRKRLTPFSIVTGLANTLRELRTGQQLAAGSIQYRALDREGNPILP